MAHKSKDESSGKGKKGRAGAAAAAGAAAGVAAAAGAAAAGGLLTDDKPDGFADVAPSGGSPSVAGEARTSSEESTDAGPLRGRTQTVARDTGELVDTSDSTTSADSSARQDGDGPSISDADDPSLAADFFAGERNFSTASASAPSVADFVENAIEETEAVVRPVVDEFGKVVEDASAVVEDAAQRFVDEGEAKLVELDDVSTVNDGGARANFGSTGADVGADIDLGFDSAFVDAGLKADADLVVTSDRVNVGVDSDVGFDVPIVGGINSRFGARVEGDEDGGSARLGAGFEVFGTGVGGDARIGVDTADGAHLLSTDVGGEAHLGLIPGIVEVGVDADSTAVIGQQSDGDFVAQVGLGTGQHLGIPGGPGIDARLGVDVGGEVGEDGGSVNAGVDLAFVHFGGSAQVGGGNTGVSFTVGGINEGDQVTVEISEESVGGFVEDVVEGVQDLAEDAGQAAEDFAEDPVGFVGGLFD